MDWPVLFVIWLFETQRSTLLQAVATARGIVKGFCLLITRAQCPDLTFYREKTAGPEEMAPAAYGRRPLSSA